MKIFARGLWGLRTKTSSLRTGTVDDVARSGCSIIAYQFQLCYFIPFFTVHHFELIVIYSWFSSELIFISRTLYPGSELAPQTKEYVASLVVQ